MKTVKDSMTTQLQRKGLITKRYEYLMKKADETTDVMMKNLYRDDAVILRNEIDRITCYIDKCNKVLRDPKGPSREDLDKLYNFKYWEN